MFLDVLNLVMAVTFILYATSGHDQSGIVKEFADIGMILSLIMICIIRVSYWPFMAWSTLLVGEVIYLAYKIIIRNKKK
jgi:hypothetical protein